MMYLTSDRQRVLDLIDTQIHDNELQRDESLKIDERLWYAGAIYALTTLRDRVIELPTDSDENLELLEGRPRERGR